MDDRFTPQAIWGRELRFYRERAGLTQVELAQRLFCSDSLISSIETGQAPATPEFAEAADRELDTDGALFRLLDWRKGVPAYPTWFIDWLPAEEKAVRLRAFEVNVIYGLLQTPDYARAVFGSDESAAQARLSRQGILTRESPPPVELHCVLDESALRRKVGSAAIMHEQLLYLLKVSEAENISLQVVPATQHRGVRGPFTVATLNDGKEVAYTEGAFGGTVSTRPEDIATAITSWESIRSEALPVGMSRDLIAQIAEEWKT
jgi:transcriptional regulator with XRE-family HTH domain